MRPLRFIPRVVDLFRRRRRARALGIPYTRSKTWEMPDRILFHGAYQQISYPPDEGTKLAFSEVFLSDLYGLRRLSPNKVRTVLDVGGHVGFFATCARMLFPAATVHAYEPNPAVAPHIASQSQWAGFTYFPEAVGSHSGRVKISGVVESVRTTTTPDPEGEVPMIPLREAVNRVGGSVDILKLDCEGAEWDILTDPGPLRAARFLRMEYHLTGGHTLPELVSRLEGLGFTMRFVEPDRVGCGMLWADRRP